MPRRTFFRDEENPYDYSTDGQVVPSNITTEYRDEVKVENQVVTPQPDGAIIRNIDEASRRIDTAGTGTIKVGAETNTAGLNRADSATDVAIWAGATQENRDTAPFRVDAAGNLTASSATIDGLILGPSAFVGTSGEAISVGDFVCIKDSGTGKIWKMNATISGPESYSFIGVAVTSTTGGNESITVVTQGIKDGMTSLVPGSNYVISNTAGGISKPRSIVDYNSTIYQDTSINIDSTHFAASTSFISPTVATTIGTVKLYLKESAATTGNAVVKIYAASGTHGVDAMPTGSALATSDSRDIGVDLSVSYALFEYTFSTPFHLTPSTTYCIVYDVPNKGGAGYVNIGADVTAPVYGGNTARYTNATTSWGNNAAGDFIFYIFTSTAITNPVDIGTAVSTTDIKLNPFGTISKAGNLTITSTGKTTVNIGFRPQYIQFTSTTSGTVYCFGYADETTNQYVSGKAKSATLCLIGTYCWITDNGFMLETTTWTTNQLVNYIAIK